VLTAVASWPLGTLALVAAGAFVGLKKLLDRRPGLEALALLAAVLPLARLAAPGSLSFDGIRHALEFIPPAALLAGAGARLLLDSRRGATAMVALSLALLEPAVELARIHPHQVAHFNPLVGGPAGARRLGFPQVEDYWATGYRRGLAWIDAHAEASSPFRPDPGEEVARNFFAVAAQRPVYLMYTTRTSWYGPIVQAAEEREPIYLEGPPGAPLLKIHRFAPAPGP
jgi:hypothetical protein